MNRADSLKTKLLNAGLADSLSFWQEKVERDLEAALKNFGPPDSRLSAACRYALMGGGKRFRPAIVHMMGKGVGKEVDLSESALAVEYFHTASLVADDFPCMDDDDVRRGRPSLHRQFGEGVALLASYALISEGYAAIGRSGARMKNKEWLPAVLACATENTGALGATGGQYLDLFPPKLDEETVLTILRMKTVTLFELAFVLGWVFGEGDPAQLAQVKKAAHHFGMAFQIADDIEDFARDQVRATSLISSRGLPDSNAPSAAFDSSAIAKAMPSSSPTASGALEPAAPLDEIKLIAQARGPVANLALIIGLERAKKQFLEEAEGFRREIKALGLENSEIANIIEILVKTGE